MPEFTKKININIDDGPEEEIGVASELKRREEREEAIRKLWIGAMVVGLVVGSFWLSFYLGSRILSPVKRLPDIQIPSAIEEMNQGQGDRMTAARQVQTVRIPAEKVKKVPLPIPAELKAESDGPRASAIPPAIKEAVRQPERTAAKVTANKTAAAQKTAGLSKTITVRAAVASDRETADAIISKLTAKGFEAFAKKLGDGSFSIQAGVFRTKKNALKLAGDLKKNGFQAKLLRE